MDNELKDREVLCAVDTRQIQRYMFHSNTMADTLGGSDLMLHILPDAIRWAVSQTDPPMREDEYDFSMDPDAEIPWFTNEGIQLQMILCAAGNAFFLARTGRLAREIFRKISRYFLDHAYSLNIATAAVAKTDRFDRDISALYRELDRVKASSGIIQPLGALPVCLREKKTGEAAVGMDPEIGDPVSRVSQLRRAETRLRNGYVPFEEMHTTRARDGYDYRAVIHADGNNLGITIGRILQCVADYEEGTRIRRRINRDIEGHFSRVLGGATEELAAYIRRTAGDGADFDREFQVIHQGGDDINVICNAVWSLPFLQYLFRNLQGATLTTGKGAEVMPLSCCAGVAIVRSDCDFHFAFDLAEECCANAKKTAKTERNLRGGLAGNWIDFQVLDNPRSQELELLREENYRTADQGSLLLRPYCLDPEAEDEPFAWGKLLERLRALKQAPKNLTQNQVIHHLYTLGTDPFDHWTDRISREAPEVFRALGSPVWRDPDNRKHATWFDPFEMTDFIPDGFPGEEDESCTVS